MNSSARITPRTADALLAAALSAELLLVVDDDREHALFRQVIRDALPRCTSAAPEVRALTIVAQEILSDPRGAARASVHARARLALVAWHRSRIMVLYERMQGESC